MVRRHVLEQIDDVFDVEQSVDAVELRLPPRRKVGSQNAAGGAPLHAPVVAVGANWHRCGGGGGGGGKWCFCGSGLVLVTHAINFLMERES